MPSRKTDPFTAYDPPHLPELVELAQATADLQEFKEAYADVFEQYAGLVSRYNDSLEQGEKAVRGLHLPLTLGPFEFLHTTVRYDAHALHEELGQEGFRECGGVVKTVVEYSIDKQRFEAKVASGMLPPQVVKRVRKETNCFRAPKKIEVP
jgi:hypothetical protein